jgi:hypothetical protein
MKAESPLIRTIELKDRNGRVVGSKEVVTYQGLLSKAHEEGLKYIKTSLIQTPSDENGRVAIARAEVETSRGMFQGYGDASPGNVNPFIVPHLIRMAETRAKARALRDAVNVGVVSFEELDGEGFTPGASDLGSGAAEPAHATRLPRNGQSGSRTVSPRPQPPQQNGAVSLMSEAQRRYLFRLLAGQGVQGEAALQYLKGHFGVEELGEVSKAAATALIDELVGEPKENGRGTPVQH